MKSRSLPRLIVFVAALIVLLWLVGAAIKLAGWLLNLLLPAAALVIIVALVISWKNRRSPKILKVSRDTSRDTKK